MCQPLGENIDKWSGPFGSRVHFLSSSGFLYECVCVSERKRAVWSGPRREQPDHSSREKVSRLRTGRPSAGTDHSTPVSLSTDTTSQLFPSLRVPDDITEQNQKEGKEIPDERRESVQDDSGVLPRPPLLSTRRENATVRHGRSDCGLVEAVSVSGRGNALINPARVKDTGACKADPGFVLHCLWIRVTATT